MTSSVATLRRIAILREAMITLTDKGAEKVREFLSSQAVSPRPPGLRVGVRGGGCSGFQYALAFDEQRDGDTVFEDKGIRCWSTRRASRTSRAP